MNIGDRIIKFRELKGMTRKELATILGVSPATITRYEKGEREPNLETIKKIASALDVSLTSLLDTKPSGHINVNDTVDTLLNELGYNLEYKLCHPVGNTGTFTNATVSISNDSSSINLSLKDYGNFKNDILSYLEFKLYQLISKDSDN